MKKKIENVIIAQNIKELKYILSNIDKKKFVCLPVSIDTQIYCDVQNIPFINLSKILDNSIHLKIQNEAEKIKKKISLNFIKFESTQIALRQMLEYQSTVVFFIYFVLKILKTKGMKNVITSGWQSNNFIFKDDYCLTSVVKNLLPDLNLISIDKPDQNFEKKNIFKSYLLKTNLNNYDKKKIIFFNSLGYNIKKIFIFLYKNKKKYKLAFFSEKKINFVKKILLKILKIYFFEFASINVKKNLNFKLPNIFYNKINISESIYKSKINFINYILDIENKALAFKNLFNKLKIHLIITNNTFGISGAILEIAKKKNIKALNIPHGTVSEYFNSGGKIFNKNVSDVIFSKYATNAIQSKICLSFKNKYKIEDKLCMITGNLIFNDNKKNKGCSILYAETNKLFYNYRCFGFQSFYEYLENLKYLNNLAEKIDFKIYVKPHPNAFNIIKFFKKKFKNLYFTNENNESLYKKIKIIISYSSSVIEDGLNSKIPIILFDRHKRYKHCTAETNVYKKNSAVYYITDKKKLQRCIQTILKSDKINFSKYIFSPDRELNIKKVFDQLL